jgi:hypothetical protein
MQRLNFIQAGATALPGGSFGVRFQSHGESGRE